MKMLWTSAALALTATAGVSPALAQVESTYTLYTTIYYDTPSFDNQVGIITGRCGRYGPQYTLRGTRTPYFEEVEAAQCVDGQIEPL